MEYKQQVWGRLYTVEVYQGSKSVWVATGEYMGEMIGVSDRSAGSTLKRWREAATYKGNG